MPSKRILTVIDNLSPMAQLMPRGDSNETQEIPLPPLSSDAS